jgi:hypothetical protein
MRQVSLAGAVLCALLSVPAPAAAQTFAPSGPWEISANDDSCFLTRNFGEGEDALTLELQRYFPGDIRAVIKSKTLVPTKSVQVRYRLNDDGAWRENIGKYNAHAVTGGGIVFIPWALLLPQVHSGVTSADIEEFFRTQDLAAHEKAAGAEVRTLTLEGAFEEPVTLRLGSLAAPIEALNACFDDQLTIWGIDVAAQNNLSRLSRPTEATGEKIYEPIAYLVSSAKPSDLTVRLIISPTGEIESCHFDKIKNPEAAIESLCKEIRRKVDFEPALDADGKGVRTAYTYRYTNPNE